MKTNKLSPREVLVRKYIEKATEIKQDDLTIYIGLGRKGLTKDQLALDCMVYGTSAITARLGEKLLSLISPILGDFLENNLDGWLDEQAENLKPKNKTNEESQKTKVPFVKPEKAQA